MAVYLLVLLTAVQLALAQPAGKKLAIMGGSMGDNPDVWSKFVEWSGGTNAKIGVVTAAGADPPDSADYYINLFLSYGADSAEWIPIHMGNLDANRDPIVIDQINQQTGFFFGGGIQSRITDSFFNDGEASPALVALRQRYQAGVLVGGSSAGAVCHGTTPMIAGGISWNALRYGAFLRGTQGPNDLNYEENGLGLFGGFIADSHVGERGREGRLVRLLADTQGRSNGAWKGIGLDEGTAFFMDRIDEPNAQGEVVGQQGVVLPDIRSARIDDSGNYWSIDDVRFHYLTEGDTINLNTMQVNFASWKRNLTGDEEYENAETSDTIFNGNRDLREDVPEFIKVSRSLFDSRESTTWGRTERIDPIFRVDFNRSVAGSVGFGGDHPDHDLWQIAYTNLRVDMKEDYE